MYLCVYLCFWLSAAKQHSRDHALHGCFVEWRSDAEYKYSEHGCVVGAHVVTGVCAGITREGTTTTWGRGRIPQQQYGKVVPSCGSGVYY